MTILKVENISKQYRLGNIGTGTLSHDLNRWWASLRGKEDPYLKVGEANDRSLKAESDYAWALQDINFDVQEGEVLGIIGKNGAGKSTLLKILSRVTSPTTGEIKTKGRIASLLEVGTGFHPELTGKENIYLNGAILGMTKTEIKAKEDEIIEFSGCERYIDTPVKRYSSGMRVRLAFAVAAFLEPDILVVDEVLAVGDAEFQKKAIGKMQDISKTDGRTVLFVSHNLGSIKSLCSSCILLEHGKIIYNGETEVAINKYIKSNSLKAQAKISDRKDRSGNGSMLVNKITFCNQERTPIENIISGEPIIIQLHYTSKYLVDKLIVGISFFDENRIIKTAISNNEQGYFLNLNNTDGIIELKFEKFPFYTGNYSLNYVLADTSFTKGNYLDGVEHAIEFKVLPGDYWNAGKNNQKRNIPIIDGSYEVFS